MYMRDEIMAVKKEIEELKEQSLAMEMLRDSKRANIKICYSFAIVIIMVIAVYFVTVALFLRYITNLGYEEITTTNTKTQEIDNVEKIENSSIINGDMYGENKAN